MRVAHATPATWRGKGPETLSLRHRIAERARGWYRAASEGEVLTRLRELGARWLTRLHKARSETQGPSAFERLLEDIVVLRCAGAQAAALQQATVVIDRLLGDLDERPADAQAVLAAIEDSNLAEARTNAAETRLTCRPHRRLDEGDLNELLDHWQRELAAKSHALRIISAFRRDLRLQRASLALVPAGVRS